IAPTTLSFYSFMEHEYGVDILKRVDRSEFDYSSTDATACGASREKSLFDMCRIPGIFKGKVLDFGCGKGAAISVMKLAGIKEIDGVEQSHMLAETARDNMKKLGEDMVAIFNEDATEFKDLLDMYDTFYLYDPFRGETFRKVIRNIEDSVRRKNRAVSIVYANPWMHRDVESGGIFRLTKQISTDFFLNIVNVYENQ
ncbi:MAG: class I SAM-dependent methyltransferase, partial [Blautia sp.]